MEETVKNMRGEGSVERRTSMLVDDIVKQVRDAVNNFSDPEGINKALDDIQAHKGRLSAAVAGTLEDAEEEERKDRKEDEDAARKVPGDDKTGTETGMGAAAGAGATGRPAAQSEVKERQERATHPDTSVNTRRR